MSGTDTQDAGTPRTLTLFAVSVLGLVLVINLEARPATAAASHPCQVTNRDIGQTYKSLQPAVDAATPGQHLTVRGTCLGGTVIDKRLAIKGVRTGDSGRPILDGDGKGHVLRVKPAARVTMRDLAVQGGSVPSRYTSQGLHHGRGAGVLNRGTLRLVDVVVRRNLAWEGAGIHNAGVLRLRGASRVRDNHAFPPGLWRSLGVAGLYNTGIATLSDASSIADNVGTGVANSGTLTLNERSSIRDNEQGGASNSGIFTLNDDSSISRNGSPGWLAGGGVANTGTLTLNGSSVIGDNLSVTYGGGVLVANGDNLTLNGTSAIRGNRAYSYGGVFVQGGGSITLNDASSIAANKTAGGGGVYLWPIGGDEGATLTMTGTSRITRNTAKEGGGGISFDSLRDTLVGVACGPAGNVHGNSPDDCDLVAASAR